MTNVIHRSFTAKKLLELPSEFDKNVSADVFHSYGLVAGHIVGLAREAKSEHGNYIKIILKALDGNDHVVASFADTPEGRFTADITAMAILRSLSVL